MAIGFGTACPKPEPALRYQSAREEVGCEERAGLSGDDQGPR